MPKDLDWCVVIMFSDKFVSQILDAIKVCFVPKIDSTRNWFLPFSINCIGDVNNFTITNFGQRFTCVLIGGTICRKTSNILYSLVGKSTICVKPYSNTKSIKMLHKEEGKALNDK